MTKIKASALWNEVLKVMKDNPNETRECQYFNGDGTPCCVVGTALFNLGEKPDAYLADNDLNAWTDVSILPVVLKDDGAVMHLLESAQHLQDQGETWGTLYEKFGPKEDDE
ncbi:hypothetical protein [Mycobacteroides chelonae]|uniref:hypothetical protein n=1 Tax=Mycobacteroides chelonae TaxID=1774 RepID=UPI000992B44D|nr:hypothetical protein [Mycobacteroides chelonae]